MVTLKQKRHKELYKVHTEILGLPGSIALYCVKGSTKSTQQPSLMTHRHGQTGEQQRPLSHAYRSILSLKQK